MGDKVSVRDRSGKRQLRVCRLPAPPRSRRSPHGYRGKSDRDGDVVYAVYRRVL